MVLTHTITFSQLKLSFQKNVEELLTGAEHLFISSAPKDLLWQTYINSFPQHLQQEHTCSCCRHFIKNYGGIVVIKNNQMHSIWGFSERVNDHIYGAALDQLNQVVLQHPVRDAFLTKRSELGTNYNYDLRPGKPNTKWEHFYLELPSKFLFHTSHWRTVERETAELRQTKQVFQRGLEEFPISSTQTILELINQGSLYRGDEHKPALEGFLQLQQEYAQLSNETQKHNYAWGHFQAARSIAKIRNSAVGTLLIDISAGMDLDKAVTRFEKVMAPANYKRPKPVVTARMIEEAEQTIAQLGLSGSLGRRHASINDINVTNVLHVNRGTRSQMMGSAFDQLREDLTVNPKTFKRVQEITLKGFIDNVLPNAQSINLLLENRLERNLVSLIAAINPDSPSLFKWDNGFSWCYLDNLADSDIKQRVKAAGGLVEAFIRMSLSWGTLTDLDLHLHGPKGLHVFYGQSHNDCNLDVDMNAGSHMSRTPVENIVFPYGSEPDEGEYQVMVHNYRNRERTNGFTVEMEFEGEIHTFDYNDIVANRAMITVVTFRYTKARGVEIISSINSSSSSSTLHSKELWGMKTNRFQEVEAIMYSPNHWDNSSHVGNKHVFFMLKGAHNPGPVRGMFNEFLKEELNQQHKRVFEALGGKMAVQDTMPQLSGVGFSTTSEGYFYVEVQGATKRILEVTV